MSKLKNNSQLIKKLYLSSCFEEIYYLKPGNVSVKSPILGMEKKKFYRAAEISGEILSNKNIKLGKSIFLACKKCMKELNTNYNLGIILLTAPIIKTAIEGFISYKQLRTSISKKISDIDKQDGTYILEAIKICNPGGIKNYNGKANINNEFTKNFSFQEIMKIGAKHDRISRCYFTLFEEIFEFGLSYLTTITKKFSKEFSTQCLFLKYLSKDLDSHIQRKYGHYKANMVKKKTFWLSKKIVLNESKKNKKKIKELDNYLKKTHTNPGTCADLTVTTLLIDKLTDIVTTSGLNKI